MRLALPKVTTPEFPKDITLWPSILDSFDDFARFSVTSEDRKKTLQYKQRTEFVSEQKQICDQTAFLKSIALQPATLDLSDGTMALAEQLK